MSPQIFRTTLLLSTLPIGLAYCAGGDAGDSAAGAGTSDEAIAATATEWRATVEARIGSLNDPEQSLTRVGQVVIGPNGRFYVSQPNDANVRVYDSTGTLITTIGRRGEGPGEFTGLTSIGLTGDTFYTFDTQLGRLSFFALEGEFRSSTQWIRGEMVRAGDWMYAWPAPRVLLSDGTALGTPSMAMPASRFDVTDVIRVVIRIPILHLGHPSQVIDTVAWQSRELRQVRLTSGGTEFRVSAPFADYPLSEMLPDGSGVVLVERRAASDTEESAFRVVFIGSARDTVFVNRFSYQPIPIPAAEVQRTVSEIPITPPDQPNPPSSSEIEGALRGADMIPATYIPVTALAVGQDGSIWLRREDMPGDSVLWHILDRTGRLQGTLRLPSGQTVEAADGDLMAAVELDEFDVPYVVRYRLQR